MSTQTIEKTDLDPTTGEPRMAHIVAPKDGKTGATLITEGRIFGTPVEALCGHTIIPQHDPKQYPNCQKCIEIFKNNTGADDGFTDA